MRKPNEKIIKRIEEIESLGYSYHSMLQRFLKYAYRSVLIRDIYSLTDDSWNNLIKDIKEEIEFNSVKYIWNDIQLFSFSPTHYDVTFIKSQNKTNNMKPFNLEQALAGKKVVTRGGKNVFDLVKFSVHTGHQLAGVMEGKLYMWSENGGYNWTGRESSCDLFMAEEERVWYQNIYETAETTSAFTTMEDARIQVASTIRTPMCIQKIAINPDTKEVKTEIVHTY